MASRPRDFKTGQEARRKSDPSGLNVAHDDARPREEHGVVDEGICRGEGGIILRRDRVITSSLVFFFRS